MNLLLLTQRIGFKPLAGAALAVGILCGLTAALAVAPAANSVVGNQASASFFDASGNSQLATSNLVQTTVQQVGSFTLDSVSSVTTTVVNTKSGAAGATLYAPHILTNTGNGADTFTIKVDSPAAGFSKVEVYVDANGDGLPDTTTPLCSAVPAATCTVAAQTVAGSNGTFQFVVAYTIPSTATTPTTPYNTGTVTVTPTASGLYTAPNTSAADLDTVNLTALASFNLTKALSVPSVAAPGGGAWPAATSSGPRSASASCSAAYASMTPATCTYAVYTLNLSNSGGAAGKFALSDTLPAGFTYVTGSAVWSNAPGVALGDGVGGDPSGIDFQSASGVITAVVTSVGVNVSQSISFMVLVNSSATVGVASTSNTAKYNPLDSPSATSVAIGTVSSSSNTSMFTVTATYGVVLGASGSTAITALDSVAGTPNGSSADLTTKASVVAGSSVKFIQTVFNTGNASDTINLSMVSNTFPIGTTFTFFQSDSVTPLLDTTGDAIVDTAPLAAGASLSFIVQANVPSSAVIGTGPFSVVISAKSFGDATKFDATSDSVTIVVGSLADLTNTASGTGAGAVGAGDLGAGPSPLPTVTNSVNAGTGSIFTLFVKNGDSSANTFLLSASQTASFPGTLPVGWTVKFVTAGATCSGSAITSIAVAAAGQTEVDACVTPPATQVAVTAQPIYFQILSSTLASTGVIISDALTDALTVTIKATYSVTLTPSNNGQAAPGGSVVYAHTLNNTGNQDCAGPITFATALSAADSSAGWTTAIYIDVNGNGVIDAGDTLVTAPLVLTLTASSAQKILVKVFAPGGVNAGSTDTVTVSATFPSGATSCSSATANDITTVVSGQIRIITTQALDTTCGGVFSSASQVTTTLAVKPGQCLTYQVIATNQGTSPVNNVSITDALPPFTSLAATQPGAQCVALGLTGTAVAYGYANAAVSCGSATNSVIPGGSITLIFAVKLNP